MDTDDALEHDPPHVRSSRPTRLCRRGTRSSTRSSSSATSASSPRGRARPRALLDARALRRRAGLRPDALALRLSAYANGVSDSTARSPARCGRRSGPGERDADRAHHQRRPPRQLARPRARRAPPLRWRASRRRRPTRRTGSCRDARRRGALAVHAAAKAPARRAGRASTATALTIGFARRFATYKRAGLVFSELERLLALPVQVVVAGKAHPPTRREGRDAGDRRARPRIRVPGTRRLPRELRHGFARALVRGFDVWLNTPRRPLEARGTSGMKAAANGVLNL